MSAPLIRQNLPPSFASTLTSILLLRGKALPSYLTMREQVACGEGNEPDGDCSVAQVVVCSLPTPLRFKLCH